MFSEKDNILLKCSVHNLLEQKQFYQDKLDLFTSLMLSCKIVPFQP